MAGTVTDWSTVKAAVATPDGAEPVTTPPPAGSGGDISDVVTDPVPSAAAVTGLPPGMEVLTISPGTNPAPEKAETSPAWTAIGVRLPFGVTVNDAVAVRRLTEPIAYTVCFPPGSGDGIGTWPAFHPPDAVVVNVVSSCPLVESSRMPTLSLLPNPLPLTRLMVVPGAAVVAPSLRVAPAARARAVPPTASGAARSDVSSTRAQRVRSAGDSLTIANDIDRRAGRD